jgi:Rieske oxygenase family protein
LLLATRGIHCPYVPGTFRPLANKDNDYLIDRGAQKDKRAYSGVFGIAMQDSSLQEGMGPIQDHAKEKLLPTDRTIVMALSRHSAASPTAHILAEGDRTAWLAFLNTVRTEHFDQVLALRPLMAAIADAA